MVGMDVLDTKEPQAPSIGTTQDYNDYWRGFKSTVRILYLNPFNISTRYNKTMHLCRQVLQRRLV